MLSSLIFVFQVLKQDGKMASQYEEAWPVPVYMNKYLYKLGGPKATKIPDILPGSSGTEDGYGSSDSSSSASEVEGADHAK